MKKIFLNWKIIYTVCCIAYMGWVLHVGTNEFDRINGQYRRLVDQLEPARISSAAVAELTEECRRESGRRTGLEEDGCLSFPPQVVEAEARKIEERLLRAKQRGIIKVVLFYAGFVAIFLLGPVVLVYLLLVGIIKVYKSVKFVR